MTNLKKIKEIKLIGGDVPQIIESKTQEGKNTLGFVWYIIHEPTGCLLKEFTITIDDLISQIEAAEKAQKERKEKLNKNKGA